MLSKKEAASGRKAPLAASFFESPLFPEGREGRGDEQLNTMPLEISRVRALCFDVDGTLSDTDDLYTQRVSRHLPRIIFPDPDHTARRIIMWLESPGNALLTLADTLGIDDEMVAVIDWMYRHRKKPWKNFLLVPGVAEMLAR